ncbi:1,4-alpha-glucan branching protein GlgB [Caldisalinibacter kiritimatiensis]|uniref:1,4-alpha-glucan branching enzyme GlgB n=1 Tax=Caldisalinibacter kiritimatiensis TaxID=1304284 RepID=R1ATU0_9FIRM|nr:1,4-alpha-glucan branching protein GlgB [Caldisalinibacter kiritimatiensis]EOD00528.1 1,4-alpha-glucan (glycogen) branching enzyme, GH-13-type [Caldisalinibacter kiritimatiensis]
MKIENFISFKDIKAFLEGVNYESYKLFGSKYIDINGKKGVLFCIWAPNAKAVRVVGDFNKWNGEKHSMNKIDKTGIWYKFIPNLTEGKIYKYEIITKENEILLKSDPFAFYSEIRPNTASVVRNFNKYKWNDDKWMEKRKKANLFKKPINIYEIHLGSWKRKDNGKFYSYKELAHLLVNYLTEMEYTHVEILPITEHPFDGSWGYQSTGYFSVTSRYGTPEEFKYFVDLLHQHNIGVILDWVPGHFCKDAHGLYRFDGTHLYEYNDPLKRENYDWGTAYFDLGKPEIHSFLISNALFWFKKFHIDGLRVDAVASMLYLDYGKQHLGIRNEYGGNENLQAVSFLKKLNEVIFRECDNPLMIAEESTSWPLVTKPTYLDGLGFNYKWNMGWMNDTLKYAQVFPMDKNKYHSLITFSMMYAFSENYILPLSHDEVVHGKKSLLDKMPGNYNEKFSNLRLLYGYMMGYPGKKLLFMGGEFGQFVEWKYDAELDWLLLDYPMHAKLKKYVKDLNHLYKNIKALYERDHEIDTFAWIDYQNYKQSIISFIRKGGDEEEFLIVICNFAGVEYDNYRIGVPKFTIYKEILNSDSKEYGGSGYINGGYIKPSKTNFHNMPYSIEIKIPAFSVIYIKPFYNGEEVKLHEKKRDNSYDFSRGARK